MTDSVKNFRVLRKRVALMLSILGCATMSQADAEEGWEWSLTPYLWASDISEDLVLDGEIVGGGDTSFEEVVDLIETSFQLHFEGMRDRWGLFADAAYVELADEEIDPGVRIDVEIEELVWEMGAIYRPAGREGALDLLLGLRLLALDESYLFTVAEFPPTSLTSSDDYWDVMVGARYHVPLAEKWLLSFRGDVSFGDTDSFWTTQALASWRFGAALRSAVSVGYRYRQLEYQKGSILDVKKSIGGFIFGVRIAF